MKIALVLLPMWSIQNAPLGLASLSAALRKEGHSVRAFDLNVKLRRELGPESWEISNARAWRNVKEFPTTLLPRISGTLTGFAQVLASEGFEAVGFTMYESNLLTVGWFSTLLKFLNPKIRIAIGGPEVGARDFDRIAEYHKQGVFDAGVIGEGEPSAIRLFRAWERGESVAGIPGVVWGENGELRSEARPPAMDVNTLLPPDFDDFKLDEYLEPFLPVQFSRGCVANCSFCNEKAFLWPSFQQKKAGGVVEHLEHLSTKYGTKSFWAVDSLVNGNHAKLNELTDILIAEGRGYAWGGNMRIDKRLRAPLNHKLKEAGCYSITFGVESGSNRILKAMRKGITRDDSVQVIKWMREAAIKVSANFIVGFPGETEEDFQQTLELVREIGGEICYYNTTIYTIDPLTEVGKNLKKFGIRTNDAGVAYSDERTSYLGNHWVSESGDSTPEIRYDRLMRLRELIATQTPQSEIAANAEG